VYAWVHALTIGLCTIGQPPMSSSIGVTQLVTGPTGSLGRHGRKAAAGFAEDSDAGARDDDRDRREERTALVAVAEAISRRARDTSLITHHHVRGQAALKALELRHRLRRAPIPVPPPLLAAFPERRQLAQPADDPAAPSAVALVRDRPPAALPHVPRPCIRRPQCHTVAISTNR
jgi:hypothetical protein